jgi:hypothetical protein
MKNLVHDELTIEVALYGQLIGRCYDSLGSITAPIDKKEG